jgi:hypothetical protein
MICMKCKQSEREEQVFGKNPSLDQWGNKKYKPPPYANMTSCCGLTILSGIGNGMSSETIQQKTNEMFTHGYGAILVILIPGEKKDVAPKLARLGYKNVANTPRRVGYTGFLSLWLAQRDTWKKVQAAPAKTEALPTEELPV